MLRRLHRKLPDARLVVAELGYGGTDDHARCTYLQHALHHIAAAQDQGARIAGVTLWTGIDNYEWLAGFEVPFGLFDADRSAATGTGVLPVWGEGSDYLMTVGRM